PPGTTPGSPPDGSIPPPPGTTPGTPPDSSVPPPPGSTPGTPPDGSVPPPPDTVPGTPPNPGTPPGSQLPPPPGSDPDPGPVPPPDPGDHHGSLAPWLVGAGILGAGALGILAFRDGARNVRALRATAASFESGAMHQGGLQAINDARLGARFTGGIGLASYLEVATPVVNRIGTPGRLTSVARGHLDHAELLAAATAMQRGVGDAVSVHEPTRAFVLDGLEHGRSMGSLLDEMDRSAGGMKPSFDNPQLRRYAEQTSILERGHRGPQDVTSGVRLQRPELALERSGSLPATAASPGASAASTASASEQLGPYRIVETGGTTKVDALVAGRGARLGGRGLASGVGTVQGVNVSSLPPGLQPKAIAASGVDPAIVAEEGLNAGFTARWHERLTPPAGPPNPAP
ncbi:MAG: hypothetical protein JWM98_2361, partial [Thermoleophilia bacterium]|nr:hypothetical protein [Thermoleophilia bacterium]